MFYVYALVDPRNGLPFYIGKGKGDRVHRHLSGRCATDNPFKDRVIAKIRRSGMEPQTTILHHDLSEPEAFLLEAEEIKKHGRRPNGTLTNLSDGGEGQSGFKFSEETKQRLSKRMAGPGNPFHGRAHSEATRKLIGDAHRGKTISKEQKAQISARHKGRVVSEETRERMRAAQAGKPKRPEHISKMAAIHRGKTISEAHRAQISAKLTGRVVSEETREKLRKALKGKPKRRRLL